MTAFSFFDMDYYTVRNLINEKCMNINAQTPEVSTIREHTTKHAAILRIYTPKNSGSFPLILFIHGGSWVAGNLETHDNLARYLCKETTAVVVSVGYQNSPEGKFPIPLEQCYDALTWTTTHAQQLHINGQVAVVGDSAGGNMAAALCLMARDRHGPKIDFQVLINPVLDLSCNGTLERQNDKLDTLRWQAKMYTNNSRDVYLPYVSPLLSQDLTKLPPALILVAEHDDLRHDGESYAEKLKAANIPTSLYRQQETNHLAGHAARASKHALKSLKVAANSLQRILHPIK